MKYGWLVLLSMALPAAPVTFNKDIAPILFEHCAPCHHAGGAGPFPLIQYEDARKHASQIAAVTARRYMPPWPPERGIGDFAGDRSLTDAQIRLIADWVKQGRVEGNASDLPAAPVFKNEWQMGTPDLILRMKEPFHMPAAGADVFRNFIIPSGLRETKYVRGLELHLDNTRVVHHANVVLDRTRSMRGRDGQDGQPGFPGMDVITEAAANTFDPDSNFLFWKPGTVPHLAPEDMSWRLDPDTDLVVNLHLQATGKPEEVQAEIGLYFSAKPPTRFPMLLQLEHDGALHIPPGDRNFAVTDHLTLPEAVDVLAIYPHAHYLGKVIQAWAVLPDGTRRDLIRIPDWDINWQAEYDYKTPISLPKGTRIEMRIRYDNSEANPRNPNHPPKLVEAGNRSKDEMGHVWLQVLPNGSGPGGEDPRLNLQEAVMRRRLEKYPQDFLAYYNLGALEQYRGKLDEALSCYGNAMRLEPKNATVLNSYGAVLLMQERVPEATQQFQRALAAEPTYLNARYNLGRALAETGDLDGAAAAFELVLEQRPDDPGAQAGLGTIYYKQRKIGPALACFRKAAQLDPQNADVQANLGTLLAISGDLRGAEAALEAALRIDPNHEAAKANLGRVQAQLEGRQ
ncbi:MAG: tetratricopeptide repeat protein [Acidobacteriaceae bacterium]|nr:tetratricopeptide repeat protein [Acidobacteriaceae bacterium]MBV8571180.1 tetratricopeptide repeat protein [Acidobacteriaceae bacterium]